MIASNDDFLARARIITPRLEILGRIHGSRAWRYVEIPSTGSRLIMCPDCDMACEIGQDIPFSAFALFGVFPFDDVEKQPKCSKKQSDNKKNPEEPSQGSTS